MAIKQRWSADQKFVGPGTAGSLEREISEIFGELCSVTVRIDADPNGHPGENLIEIESASILDDQTLDAGLAAFPTTLVGVTGTFAVTSGQDYLLKEVSLFEGETVVLDVHVHAAMGDSTSFATEYSDWYVVAKREAGGSVTTDTGGAVSIGDIPGFQIRSVNTTSTTRVVMSLRRDGSLTLLMNDIKEESRGTVPAP